MDRRRAGSWRGRNECRLERRGGDGGNKIAQTFSQTIVIVRVLFCFTLVRLCDRAGWARLLILFIRAASLLCVCAKKPKVVDQAIPRVE
jgi:hypothetical protein